MPTGNSKGSSAHKYPKLKKFILELLESSKTRRLTSIRGHIREQYPDLWKEIYSPPKVVNGLPLGKGSIDLELLYGLLDIPSRRPCGGCGKLISIEKGSGMVSPRLFCSVRCSAGSEGTRNKYREACIKRWGVDNSRKSEEVKGSIRATWRVNFEGAEHPLHHPDVMYRVNKNRFRSKTFLDRSGRAHIYQGWEGQVLKFLEQNTLVSEFTTDCRRMPAISYTESGSSHKYYPDILIRLSNGRKLLVEVKSEWTLRRNPETLKRNICKFRNAEKECARHKDWEFWLAGVNLQGSITWIKNPSKRVSLNTLF